MFEYNLSDFNFEECCKDGTCSVSYKIYVDDLEYMKFYHSSKDLCKIINGGFKEFVEYINQEIKYSLEKHALSVQFQKNMNSKYGGSSPSQTDVQGFGSSVRQLWKEYQEDYT